MSFRRWRRMDWMVRFAYVVTAVSILVVMFLILGTKCNSDVSR